MRFGLNSGPTTAGVLRGEKARFQLFGDVSPWYPVKRSQYFVNIEILTIHFPSVDCEHGSKNGKQWRAQQNPSVPKDC
jgi:hypothetical protein